MTAATLAGLDPPGGSSPGTPEATEVPTPGEPVRPDRVAEMEGGNRFLLARRRARRKDLMKEATNVGLATLMVAVVSGALLLEAGVTADVAALLALAIAAACGWTLGREVASDVVENERIVREGGRPR